MKTTLTQKNTCKKKQQNVKKSRHSLLISSTTQERDL